MSTTGERTELNKIGEFGLIDRIKSKFATHNPETKVGIGDDAAVLAPHSSRTVVSTDLLVEGVHFDLSYVPVQHLGYKAIAVNVSDIAAMNALPKQVTVSLALSNRFSAEAIDAFYQGVRAACQDYKVDLVGGDTSSSTSGLLISVTAVGEVEPEKITLRSGAKEGDIICATGDLGGAYVGLQILEREKQVFMANPDMQPQLEEYDYIVKRQLKPSARMDIIHELKEQNLVPTSMIDISDGLASELLHLARASDVTMCIYEDKLPIDKMTYDTAISFNIDPITCALNGGEDYELLFTIGQEDYESLKNHPDIHFIGYVKKNIEPSHLITKQGNVVPITAQGWNHWQQGDTESE